MTEQELAEVTWPVRGKSRVDRDPKPDLTGQSVITIKHDFYGKVTWWNGTESEEPSPSVVSRSPSVVSRSRSVVSRSPSVVSRSLFRSWTALPRLSRFASVVPRSSSHSYRLDSLILNVTSHLTMLKWTSTHTFTLLYLPHFEILRCSPIWI